MEKWSALEEKQGRGVMEKWWSRDGVRCLRSEVEEDEGCGEWRHTRMRIKRKTG